MIHIHSTYIYIPACLPNNDHDDDGYTTGSNHVLILGARAEGEGFAFHLHFYFYYCYLCVPVCDAMYTSIFYIIFVRNVLYMITVQSTVAGLHKKKLKSMLSRVKINK